MACSEYIFIYLCISILSIPFVSAASSPPIPLQYFCFQPAMCCFCIFFFSLDRRFRVRIFFCAYCDSLCKKFCVFSFTFYACYCCEFSVSGYLSMSMSGISRLEFFFLFCRSSLFLCFQRL